MGGVLLLLCWVVLSVAAALLLGGVIARRDTQVPVTPDRPPADD